MSGELLNFLYGLAGLPRIRLEGLERRIKGVEERRRCGCNGIVGRGFG